MKPKLDAEGHVVVQGDLVVYVHDDGREAPLDAAATLASITSLRGEAMSHRKAKEAAEGKLKSFEGIDDPEAARTALKTVANLDTKRLVDAGQVDAAVAAAIKPLESKLSDAEKRNQGLEGDLFNEKVGGAFARSKYLAEKTVLPPDLAQSAFGRYFKIEDGKVRAYDVDGNPIFSRTKGGSHAEFDEAIEILIDAYPRKDSILKADNRSGSGARQDGGGGGSGAKTMTRADWDTKDPAEKQAFLKAGGQVTDKAA
jgi:uncharacterized protein DUF6651